MRDGFERIERGRLQDWHALLGRKVSIRYRLRDDPDEALSEAIGVVMSVSEGDDPEVAILTKRGVTRRVVVADVLAGKIWPSPG